MNNKTYLSWGDLVDLYYKVKQRGYQEFISLFKLSDQDRIKSKWNKKNHSSDFWIIPEIRSRWNEKCTGDKKLEYEDYFVDKYLTNKSGLRMLSIGCGTGARERKYAKYPNFSLIEGIDLADKQIDEAKRTANELNLNNIKYYSADFVNHDFEKAAYDVILFNSSLHHFDNIDRLLEFKVKPLLKNEGYLVIFEFVGPTRLQWTNEQLDFSNMLLAEMPPKYKKRFNSTRLKKKVYRPGLWRMLAVDPSEAIDSDKIVPSLHKHFKIIEEKQVGWNILHILLKDIAHNFLIKDEETQDLIQYLFNKEDEFLDNKSKSDAIFGIYKLL